MKNRFTVRAKRELNFSPRQVGTRRIKIILLALSLVFAGAACNKNQTLRNDATVKLAGKTLFVQVASTDLEQAIGLSKFTILDDNRGMLFPIDPPRKPTFWMKNMKFGIDIVWIKGNEVVDLSLYVQPEPDKQDYQLATYSPKREVDAVLELPAGWATKNNVKIGDPIVIEHRPKQ